MDKNSKELEKIFECFPKAFINRCNEMIIYPKENTYFLLDNVNNKLELDCKVLEYCSRQASKGLDKKSREYHFNGISQYFDRIFTQYEMDKIYTNLGNGIKRSLCIKYIQSNFNIEVLEKCKD